MPPASSSPPPAISGPAHGVGEASGQVTDNCAGAGATPSDATRTLIPAGSWSGAISRSSCWNSSIQRSEPIGSSSTGSASASASPAGSSAGTDGATAVVTTSSPSRVTCT